MTDNSIAFPLSSVATKSSLEKLSTVKDAATTSSFQSVLDNYVSQSNSNDKPVKNDSSKAQNNSAEKTSENKRKAATDSNETSPVEEKESAESAQSSPTDDKKELDSATNEDQMQSQTSDIASINLQDGTNIQASSLTNIIAAQTFNNGLVQQEKAPANSIETVKANAAGTPGSTADTENTPLNNSDAFASQLSSSKATTEKLKLPDSHIDTQLPDQLKLTNTINTLETPALYAGQTQTSNLTANVNSVNHSSLPSYAIASDFYSDNWNTSVHQQILSLRHNNIDNASLILNPEHLGPIQVSIQIDAQSQTSVQFWSQNPEVRQALRDALPNLNTLFQESGLQLGSADVSSQQNSSSDNTNPKPNQVNGLSAETIDDSDMENQITTSLSVKNLVNVYI